MASSAGNTTTDKAIFPLLVVNFIGTLGFSLVIPFLVFLVDRFSGGSALVYGAIGATYSAFQLIGAPILGRWSDTVGRKKVLLYSQIGTMVAWIIFLVALFIPINKLVAVDSPLLGSFIITTPLVVLFLARALDGITGGNVSVANAYVSDVTEENDRSRQFGKMAVAANLGFVIGPASAGLLGATYLAEKLPVTGALLLALAGVIIIAKLLPDSKPCSAEHSPEASTLHKSMGHAIKDCHNEETKTEITFKQALKMPHVPFILTLYFIIFLGFNVFYTAFPVHAVQGLSWTVGQMGFFFAILSLLMAIVQGPVLSRLTKIFSDAWLATAGSIILGSNFFLFLSTSTLLLYIAAALFAIGNGIMWPAITSYLSRIAGESAQGAIQGFAASAGSLASIIGLLAGGALYDAIGTGTFVTTGIVILSTFFFCLNLKNIDQQLTSSTKAS